MEVEGTGVAYCAQQSKGLQRRSAEGPARGWCQRWDAEVLVRTVEL